MKLAAGSLKHGSVSPFRCLSDNFDPCVGRLPVSCLVGTCFELIVPLDVNGLVFTTFMSI